MADHDRARSAPVGAVPAATRALLIVSSGRSRAERPEPILIEGARPRSPCEERWGAVHLPQVWARKLRNRGMVQPEPPSPDPHRGIPRLDSSLDSGARPPVALRGKPGGRAPRRPGRDAPGDARRWSPGTREDVTHGLLLRGAGQRLVRARDSQFHNSVRHWGEDE